MIFARGLLVCLLLLGCEARRAATPDWVRSAPATAVAATSFRADWALQQPRLRRLLERIPIAERALDLFLMRARINFAQETGRLTVYQLGPGPGPGFLLQLGGFRDPAGLQVALANGFPADSAQAVNPDRPVFVILDAPPHHIRALADGEGRVWLGDLADLGSATGPAPEALAAASDWLSPAATIQGFIRIREWPAEQPGQAAENLARSLPRGIEALAWAVRPGLKEDAPNSFELALAGSGAGVQHGAPWLQRFLATVSAIPGSSSQAPDILQEKARIGVRCLLTQEQIDVAMGRLGQSPLPCH